MIKPLKEHVIIYDDECPMCNVYTRAFIKSGMLDKQGREAYSKMNDSLASQIDQDRACNEIALVNRNTGQVTYGIESLFSVIAHSMPFFNRLFHWKPFHYAMQQLYAFVSYNRKVIVPGKPVHNLRDCKPGFSLKNRLAFLTFTWLLTAFILTKYTTLLASFLPASGGFTRELLVCGGQMVFQGMIVLMIRRGKLMDYLGNMMTVSLIGALLLLLPMALGNLLQITNPWFYLVGFGVTVMLMGLEHIRRVKLLEMHWSMTATWVLYRLLVLALIIY